MENKSLREGFIRKKKKSCEFSQLGGGHPKMLTFSQLFFIFFACSNSSISAIKIFFEGGKSTPWPIYFENLDNFHLNIWLFSNSFGFSRINTSLMCPSLFMCLSLMSISITNVIISEFTSISTFERFCFDMNTHFVFVQ